MVRNVVAVVLGLVACQVVFGVLAQGTVLVWPHYAMHARDWMLRKVFSFPADMACLTLAIWVAAFAAAGWVARRIARDHGAVWVMAFAALGYAAFVHLLTRWEAFPWWYNLAVVGAVLPGIGWGARQAAPADIAGAA